MPPDPEEDIASVVGRLIAVTGWTQFRELVRDNHENRDFYRRQARLHAADLDWSTARGRSDLGFRSSNDVSPPGNPREIQMAPTAAEAPTAPPEAPAATDRATLQDSLVILGKQCPWRGKTDCPNGHSRCYADIGPYLNGRETDHKACARCVRVNLMIRRRP